MIKKCKYCNKEFETTLKKKKFCSESCGIKKRNGKKKKIPKVFNCLICGKEFIQQRTDNKTCSPLCRQRLWVKNNPEKDLKRRNSDSTKKSKKEWEKRNVESRKKIKQNYKKRRRQKDLKYKIDELISNAIRLSINNKSFKKWEEIVGYSSETLINHLTKTLPKNLTWEKYLNSENKYHIDHIIPKDAYNFNSYEDKNFKKCWNYKNLRIISKQKNLKKSSSIDLILIKEYKIEHLLP